MKLGELLEEMGIKSDSVLEIVDVVVDSRKVKPGTVFIAYEGVAVDGHDFINEAIDKGAVVIFGEKELKLRVPYFRVKNGRLVWAKLLAKLYGNPERRLKIIGVTGTDGKTTTSNLIASILEQAGKKVGLVSTVFARIGDEQIDTGLHTTSPDPEVLWGLLKKMVESGCEYAVLEVTSHALEQERVGEIEFGIGVLTNLTSDHLEIHKTVEEYAKAKAKLFARSKVGVINKRSNFFELFTKSVKGKVITYDAEKEIENVGYEMIGGRLRQSFYLKIRGKKTKLQSGLLGSYNLENILAAVKVAEELMVEEESIERGVEAMSELPGRMEFVANNRDIKAVVDFAHTNNAMREVLTLVKELKKKSEQIIIVFGCNGERDRSKRAPMGETACSLADYVIVTAEDPRKESMDQIYGDIKKGCDKTGAIEGGKYFRIDDRELAIKEAVEMSRKGDWILCLGKGHEKSMNIGGVEETWNEVGVLSESLR